MSDHVTNDDWPEPEAHITIETTGADPQVFDLGPAVLDAIPGGGPDTAVQQDEDLVILAADVDGDGRADKVIGYDATTGEQAFDAERDDTAAGGWRPAAEPGAEPAPVEIPPRFRDIQPQGTDLVATALAYTNRAVAESAAGLWTTAYPGEPWPTDDTGAPHRPETLLHYIAGDDKLPQAVSEAADEAVTDYEKAIGHAI
ncbi:hypothetical protein AB0M54_22990 [Actinoplanes sp. NPDC051470]|uniref:hypothetical protein n=1 Tax=unclassified Actinoplanes TaxID=2626549 RepID=UPI00341C0562